MKTIGELGKIVRFHRKKGGLSQIELADLAGVGKAAIFELEKGRAATRFNTLEKVFGVLNISMKIESPLMSEYRGIKDGGSRDTTS